MRAAVSSRTRVVRPTTHGLCAMRCTSPDSMMAVGPSRLGVVHLLASPFFSSPAEAANHLARAPGAWQARANPSPSGEGPGAEGTMFDRPSSASTPCGARGPTP